MTDDIVARLRDWAECEDDILIEAACADFHAAADEINRLRAALEKIAQHDMQAIALDALRLNPVRTRPAKEASDDPD